MIIKKPLVYIILVNYRAINDTIECINSLKKISYDNYKIVIIDNESIKEDYNQLAEIEDIILFASDENLGFAGANNIGIKYAIENQAEYVLLLNNDTVVNEEFLDKLMETALRESNVGVVGGKIFYYDYKDTLWYAGANINKFKGYTKHIGLDQKDSKEFSQVMDTEHITGCLMLVPIEVIKKVGLMDESYFLYYEETDWNARISKSGYRLIYNPEAIIYHKVSKSTNNLNYKKVAYLDRNSYFFIMKNYGFVNRIFMYIYRKTKLISKYFYFGLRGEKEKQLIVKETYNMIRYKKMGKID